MDSLKLTPPNGFMPLAVPHVSKLHSVHALVIQFNQVPILPPISTSCSMQSFNASMKFPLTAAGVASTPPLLAITPPIMPSYSSLKVDANSSTPSTVPNTPILNFATRDDAGDQSEDTHMCASSSDAHNHANGDSDVSRTQDDKNAPVYTGVSRSGLNGRWRAQLSTRGRTVHLGTFPTAEEAARAWDRAAVQERGKAAVTNFTLTDYVNADGTLKMDAVGTAEGARGQRTAEANECSRGHKSYRGVYHSGTYGRWKARIVVKGHKIHLGTFASAEDAARAWDLKALEYRGAGTVTNFDPALYASDDPPRPRSLDDEHALDAYTEHELANVDALEAHQSTRNPPAPQHSCAKLSSISSAAAAAAAAADRKRCRLLSTSPCPSELSGLSTPRAHDEPSPRKQKMLSGGWVSRSGTLAGEESEAAEREREQQQQQQQQQDRAFAAGKRNKNQKVCAAGPPPALTVLEKGRFRVVRLEGPTVGTT